MKKIKLLTTIVLATTLITTSLFGCSNKNNDSSAKPEEKVTEITWWNFPNFEVLDGQVGNYEKKLIEEFNKKHPNIKVNIEMLAFTGGPEKINAAIASNSMPDILYDAPGRIIDYGRKGVLAPVDDMIKKLNGDVPDAILKGCETGGTYYMYPFNTANFMMGVNKTMFDEAGLTNLLPLNKPDRTWTIEEFEVALKAIKKAKPDVLPVQFFSKSSGGDQGTRAFVENIYGGETINKEMTAYGANKEAGVKALEWVKRGLDEGFVAKGGEALAGGDAIELFLQGKSAFSLLDSTVTKKVNSAKKVGNFEEVLLPIPSPGNPRLEPLIGGMCVFDNGDKDRIEASKIFIDFLCNDEVWGKKNLISTGGFSVKKSLTGIYGDDKEMAYAESTSKFIRDYYNTVPGFAEMRTYWFPALQSITLGQVTPKEGLDTFVERANATLKK